MHFKPNKWCHRMIPALLAMLMLLSACGGKKNVNEGPVETPAPTAAPVEVKNVDFIYSLRDTNDQWWDQPYGYGTDDSVTRKDMYEAHLRQLYGLYDGDPLPKPKDFSIKVTMDGEHLHTLRASYNQFLFDMGNEELEMTINSTKPVIVIYALGSAALTFFPMTITAVEVSDDTMEPDEWYIRTKRSDTRTQIYMEQLLSDGYCVRITFPDVVPEDVLKESGNKIAFSFTEDEVMGLAEECIATLYVSHKERKEVVEPETEEEKSEEEPSEEENGEEVPGEDEGETISEKPEDESSEDPAEPTAEETAPANEPATPEEPEKTDEN